MRKLLVLLASGLLLTTAQAEIRGDVATGRAIAERWCSGCHVVSPEQTSGVADVKSFMAIARDAGGDLQPLEDFLADPHPVMADMSLTRQEIRDLVAYIDSLR